MSNEQYVEDILAEAAKATADKPKKERVKKSDGEVPQGEAKAKREPKPPKEPKQWPVWNEDGTQATNEDGTPKTSTTRMKKPRVKKEGSGTRNFIRDDQTLHITDAGVAAGAKFREGTKRHANFHAIQDGMTAGDYFAKVEGGRAEVGTFLTWYVAQGYVEVGGNAEAPAAE